MPRHLLQRTGAVWDQTWLHRCIGHPWQPGSHRFFFFAFTVTLFFLATLHLLTFAVATCCMGRRCERCCCRVHTKSHLGLPLFFFPFFPLFILPFGSHPWTYHSLHCTGRTAPYPISRLKAVCRPGDHVRADGDGAAARGGRGAHPPPPPPPPPPPVTMTTSTRPTRPTMTRPPPPPVTTATKPTRSATATTMVPAWRVSFSALAAPNRKMQKRRSAH